jgi:hypothetical protein
MTKIEARAEQKIVRIIFCILCLAYALGYFYIYSQTGF